MFLDTPAGETDRQTLSISCFSPGCLGSADLKLADVQQLSLGKSFPFFSYFPVSLGSFFSVLFYFVFFAFLGFFLFFFYCKCHLCFWREAVNIKDREKAVAPHSSTLAWKIPWMEEPGRLQSMGSLRVGHD